MATPSGSPHPLLSKALAARNAYIKSERLHLKRLVDFGRPVTVAAPGETGSPTQRVNTALADTFYEHGWMAAHLKPLLEGAPLRTVAGLTAEEHAAAAQRERVQRAALEAQGFIYPADSAALAAPAPAPGAYNLAHFRHDVLLNNVSSYRERADALYEAAYGAGDAEMSDAQEGSEEGEGEGAGGTNLADRSALPRSRFLAAVAKSMSGRVVDSLEDILLTAGSARRKLTVVPPVIRDVLAYDPARALSDAFAAPVELHPLFSDATTWRNMSIDVFYSKVVEPVLDAAIFPLRSAIAPVSTKGRLHGAGAETPAAEFLTAVDRIQSVLDAFVQATAPPPPAATPEAASEAVAALRANFQPLLAGGSAGGGGADTEQILTLARGLQLRGRLIIQLFLERAREYCATQARTDQLPARSEAAWRDVFAPLYAPIVDWAMRVYRTLALPVGRSGATVSAQLAQFNRETRGATLTIRVDEVDEEEAGDFFAAGITLIQMDESTIRNRLLDRLRTYVGTTFFDFERDSIMWQLPVLVGDLRRTFGPSGVLTGRLALLIANNMGPVEREIGQLAPLTHPARVQKLVQALNDNYAHIAGTLQPGSREIGEIAGADSFVGYSWVQNLKIRNNTASLFTFGPSVRHYYAPLAGDVYLTEPPAELRVFQPPADEVVAISFLNADYQYQQRIEDKRRRVGAQVGAAAGIAIGAPVSPVSRVSPIPPAAHYTGQGSTALPIGLRKISKGGVTRIILDGVQDGRNYVVVLPADGYDSLALENFDYAADFEQAEPEPGATAPSPAPAPTPAPAPVPAPAPAPTEPPAAMDVDDDDNGPAGVDQPLTEPQLRALLGLTMVRSTPVLEALVAQTLAAHPALSQHLAVSAYLAGYGMGAYHARARPDAGAIPSWYGYRYLPLANVDQQLALAVVKAADRDEEEVLNERLVNTLSEATVADLTTHEEYALALRMQLMNEGPAAAAMREADTAVMTALHVLNGRDVSSTRSSSSADGDADFVDDSEEEGEDGDDSMDLIDDDEEEEDASSSDSPMQRGTKRPRPVDAIAARSSAGEGDETGEEDSFVVDGAGMTQRDAATLLARNAQQAHEALYAASLREQYDIPGAGDLQEIFGGNTTFFVVSGRTLMPSAGWIRDEARGQGGEGYPFAYDLAEDSALHRMYVRAMADLAEWVPYQRRNRILPNMRTLQEALAPGSGSRRGPQEGRLYMEYIEQLVRDRRAILVIGGNFAEETRRGFTSHFALLHTAQTAMLLDRRPAAADAAAAVYLEKPLTRAPAYWHEGAAYSLLAPFATEGQLGLTLKRAPAITPEDAGGRTRAGQPDVAAGREYPLSAERLMRRVQGTGAFPSPSASLLPAGATLTDVTLRIAAVNHRMPHNVYSVDFRSGRYVNQFIQGSDASDDWYLQFAPEVRVHYTLPATAATGERYGTALVPIAEVAAAGAALGPGDTLYLEVNDVLAHTVALTQVQADPLLQVPLGATAADWVRLHARMLADIVAHAHHNVSEQRTGTQRAAAAELLTLTHRGDARPGLRVHTALALSQLPVPAGPDRQSLYTWRLHPTLEMQRLTLQAAPSAAVDAVAEYKRYSERRLQNRAIKLDLLHDMYVGYLNRREVAAQWRTVYQAKARKAEGAGTVLHIDAPDALLRLAHMFLYNVQTPVLRTPFIPVQRKNREVVSYSALDTVLAGNSPALVRDKSVPLPVHKNLLAFLTSVWHKVHYRERNRPGEAVTALIRTGAEGAVGRGLVAVSDFSKRAYEVPAGSKPPLRTLPLLQLLTCSVAQLVQRAPEAPLAAVLASPATAPAALFGMVTTLSVAQRLADYALTARVSKTVDGSAMLEYHDANVGSRFRADETLVRVLVEAYEAQTLEQSSLVNRFAALAEGQVDRLFDERDAQATAAAQAVVRPPPPAIQPTLDAVITLSVLNVALTAAFRFSVKRGAKRKGNAAGDLVPTTDADLAEYVAREVKAALNTRGGEVTDALPRRGAGPTPVPAFPLWLQLTSVHLTGYLAAENATLREAAAAATAAGYRPKFFSMRFIPLLTESEATIQTVNLSREANPLYKLDLGRRSALQNIKFTSSIHL